MAMEGHNNSGERTQFLEDPTLFNLIFDERWQEAWNLVESDPAAPYNARVTELSRSFPLHLLCRKVNFIDHQEDPEFSDDEDRENTDSQLDRKRNEEIYQLARFMIQQSHTIQTPIVQPEPAQMDVDRVTFESHRSILTLKDDGGDTPLYDLLFFSGDPNMIQILLDGALSSPGILEQLQTSTNSSGETPLHFALLGNCTFTTFRLMVQFFHGSRLTPDEIGNLPIHCAMMSERLASPRQLRLLLDGCSESLLGRNNEGMLPLDEMEEEHFSEWNGVNEAERRSLWNRLEPILRAIMESVENRNDALPTLHAISSGLSFIPTKFLRIALDYIFDSTTVYDSDGMIPLHRAVSKPPAEESIDMFTKSVQLLITEATVGLPTHSGRLSIHLAAESNQPEVVVSNLVDMAPQTLSVVDPVTEFIPFQLAAVEDNNSLTNVYSLLRMDPSLL